MSNKRADRVWLRLSQWYGARWIEAFGPKPTEDWIRAVTGAADSQIAAALLAIRTKHLSHPPTLPEFEAALRAAKPKEATTQHGRSLLYRLEDAMMRACDRVVPCDIRWLARKNPEGKLVIYGVEFRQPWSDHKSRITEDDIGMEGAA